MRIVLCSDVHGNVVALEAVLADIRRQAAPDVIVVAGDLVLLGPRPAESLALLRSIPGARFVMGNTDWYLITGQADEEAVTFARKKLTDEELSFVANLPFSQTLEAAPGHELLVVHANPKDLERSIKPETAEALIRPLMEGVTADVVAFGHYHVPFVREFDGRILLDVASVGFPRDGDQRAVYAIVTWENNAWRYEHRRVAFDIAAVARDFVAVGFPDGARAGERLLRARY